MKRIRIKGKEYPVRMTLGALLRFKRETGKDVGEIQKTDIADMVILLWCCVASACKSDGMDFGLSLEQFADCLEPGHLEILTDEMERQAVDDDQKKSPEM